MQSSLTLQQMNALVREAILARLPDAYWVTAELSEVRFHQRGHCYVGLVEKAGDSNALLARASGVIWAGYAQQIIPRFESETGCKWESGIKVLIRVQVSFHEAYGLQYVITNIDPTYTLGDLQRRRAEIVRQLTAEGVVDMNRALTLPRPLLRIAIISSPTAAGYGDFCQQLAATHYAFRTQLFPATMQGDGVERSVIAALERIVDEAGRWDAVAIIRGGGAVSDLNGFETYLLAAAVAQFPLPVLTGIGHERDETVLDLVACRRFKTPTAVAAFLVETAAAEENAIQTLGARLQAMTQRILHQEQLHTAHLQTRLRTAAVTVLEQQATRRVHLAALLKARTESLVQSEWQRLQFIAPRLSAAVRHTLRSESERQTILVDRLRLRIHGHLETQRQKLLFIAPMVSISARRILRSERDRHQSIRDKLALASPERSLRLGFSITRVDGRVVRDAAQLRPGQTIVTRLARGEVQSQVMAAAATMPATGSSIPSYPSNTKLLS